MNEQEGTAEAGAETAAVETTAPEAAAVEAKAKDMGWLPKGAWKGDPDKWRPADEYVRRGEEILPFVQKENRELKAKLASLETKTAATIAGIEKMSKLGLQKQREQLVAQYEAAEDRAGELGDTKTLRATRTAKEKALEAFDAEAAPAAKPAEADLPDRAVVEAWARANPWYGRSPMLHGAADEAFDEVTGEMPDATMEERLAETRARVEAQFPDRFPKKAGARGPRVEGSNGRGGNGGDSGGELWAKVPSEARAQANRMITEERLFDPPGKKKAEALTPAEIRAARESYARSYLEP